MSQVANADDARAEIDHKLADAVKAIGLQANTEKAFANFVEAALDEAEDMLESNRTDAKVMGKVDDDSPSVDDVLSPDNVRDIEYEAPAFKGYRLTVWLKDAPAWANTADRRTFSVGDINDRNRDLMAVIDVRPF